MLALALVVAGQCAHAWGNDGHRITGHIANNLLSESARKHVRELLGHDDLAALATELDEQRDLIEKRHPQAARWHYENRAVCGDRSACPQGHCVTRAIERFSAVLADTKATRTARVEALTILVHLLGDLHQPLHLADNGDRGGNDLWVRLPGERDARRLHEAWDTRFVRLNMQRRAAEPYANFLLNKHRGAVAKWQTGTAGDWARESLDLGRNHGYRALQDFTCAIAKRTDTRTWTPTPLSPEYVAVAREVIDVQLARGGARIAFVLDRLLTMKSL